MLNSRTTHTLHCDYCPRKTTATTGTPEEVRAKAAARGWESRPAPGIGGPDVDLCPNCAKANPPATKREVVIGKGRPRRPRLFSRNTGIHPPAGPSTPGPPAGPGN